MPVIYSDSKPVALPTFSGYELIQNLAHDPVIIFDPVTNLILDVNDLACKTYKINRADFVGLSAGHLWTDGLRESEMFGILFEKGRVKNFETAHLRSDGSRMQMMVNASLIDINGKEAIISVNQNVTEQRRAEEGIKLARVEWRDTIDTVPDMIIVEDENGRLRRCNKATSDFLHLPYEKIIGSPIGTLFSALPKIIDDDGGERANVAATDAAEHLRLRHWEGRFKGYNEWFEVANHPIKTQTGSEIRWVHVIRNITRRKLADEQLRKFFTVVEQAANSIFITDLKGNIQYANSMVEEISGALRDRFVGKTIFDAKPSLSRETFDEEIVPTLLKTNTWQKIHKTKGESEEIFEEMTVSKVKDDKGSVFNYVFICRDVTETRRLESIAEAVNMMDNVGYIFSGIRHELGNPINSVKMALTVLEKNLGKWDTEQVGVYVNRCMWEISRVEYLLRTLKTFSLHENPKMEKVSLADFMNNFISFTREDFEKRGIEINLKTDIEPDTAWCDSRALHQIMLNLIANAAEAFGGVEHPKIVIALSHVKNRLQISVADNGGGMSEKQLANLFKPFYTSKESGTGLGLVIVQKMLVRMNGTIAVESAVNAGTKVIFTLESANGED